MLNVSKIYQQKRAHKTRKNCTILIASRTTEFETNRTTTTKGRIRKSKQKISKAAKNIEETNFNKITARKSEDEKKVQRSSLFESKVEQNL